MSSNCASCQVEPAGISARGRHESPPGKERDKSRNGQARPKPNRLKLRPFAAVVFEFEPTASDYITSCNQRAVDGLAYS